MCYHADFGRSALKGVGINTGEPQNSGALEFRCQQRPRLRMASRGKNRTANTFAYSCSQSVGY